MTLFISDRPAGPSDNPLTLASVGVLVYVAADVTHHALGHGIMCLLQGGRIVSLSAIFVDCTRRGPIIDAAGPLANLVVGLACLLGLGGTRRPAMRVLLALAAAENLFWFGGIVFFSAITLRDDWAFVIAGLTPAWAWRAASALLGAAVYALGVRILVRALRPFLGAPPDTARRVRRIAMLAYVAAGLTAGATAVFDPQGWAGFVHHAATQSFGLNLGMLIVPVLAGRLSPTGTPAPLIALQNGWIATAFLTLMLSIIFLGRGVAVSF